MKLVDLDIKSFIEKLESSSPTPGGGSASALAVALGISLVLMVVNITAAKKKFKTLADDDRTEFLAAAGRLDALKEEALALVDEDAAVYAEVLAAYRLPSE
ncbi:MAG: cyclodeaminase/cyclohydrolase family protein, partial [Bacilli bacterium]